MKRAGPDPELLARIARALAPRAEIQEAYLFGSRARGDAGPLGDIDVAVHVDMAMARAAAGPWGYRAGVTSDLMDALETDRVDLAVLNYAPPLLYHRVLRDGARAFSRDLRATTTREGRAISRYCDFVPWMDRMDAAWRANRS